jgi:PPOX class probable F420-dependent enzyme
MNSTVDALGAAQYLLVTTFRKDGRTVPTPVWGARDGDALVFWSVTDAGKIKRIRRTPRVLVGPCDLRGRPTGESVPGTAVILDAAGTERVRALLRHKYGLMGRLTMWGSLVRRGRDGTIGVRITLS